MDAGGTELTGTGGIPPTDGPAPGRRPPSEDGHDGPDTDGGQGEQDGQAKDDGQAGHDGQAEDDGQDGGAGAVVISDPVPDRGLLSVWADGPLRFAWAESARAASRRPVVATRAAGRRMVDAVVSGVTPVGVLSAMVTLYALVFGRLTWVQQSHFGTFGFDMGIFDQQIWLLSRFKEPFITLRGLSLWGNHVNPNVFLLVPIYWLGGGPHALYVVETLALALGAVPVWLLARDRMHDEWSALVVSFAYLLFPSLEWINWWHFHPEALAVTPLLFAWWFAGKRRWWPYAVCVVLVASCKEDAALVVLALGVLVAIYYSKRAALFTILGGAAWLTIALRVIMPGATGGASPFYLGRFSALGHSLPQIVFNIFFHPSKVWRLSFKADRLSYYRMMLSPVAFLAVLDPAVLVCLPAVLVNVTSNFGYTHEIQYQYQALVLAGLFIGTCEACSHLATRPGLRHAVMGILAATALAANVAWSPSPMGVKFHSGIWALQNPDEAVLNFAVAMVPKNAGVSASYNLDSHLTHRVHIYEWPNPFHAANWGIDDQHLDPTSNVQYLVLDTDLNQDMDPLLESLIQPGGPFQVIFRAGPALVARRSPP
jgi:uncharacterized membrane protein